jgi:hypothetical protein
MGIYIGTYKPKWILWSSHHWELLIGMLSKSSKNLSSRKSESLGIQISKSQSMVRVALTLRPKDKERMARPRITNPSHQQIRLMGSQISTLKSGASFTKFLGTILMNVASNDHFLLRRNPQGHMMTQNMIKI